VQLIVVHAGGGAVSRQDRRVDDVFDRSVRSHRQFLDQPLKDSGKLGRRRKVGGDRARVDRDDDDALALEAANELEHVPHHGELGGRHAEEGAAPAGRAAGVVVVDVADEAVRNAADEDDADGVARRAGLGVGGRGAQAVEEQRDQQEVAEVVDLELALEAVLGEARDAEARVGDEQVQGQVAGEEALGAAARRRERVEVQRQELDGRVGGRRLDLGNERRRLGLVAAGEEEVEALRGQAEGRRAAQPRRAAGQQAHLADAAAVSARRCHLLRLEGIASQKK